MLEVTLINHKQHEHSPAREYKRQSCKNNNLQLTHSLVSRRTNTNNNAISNVRRVHVCIMCNGNHALYLK